MRYVGTATECLVIRCPAGFRDIDALSNCELTTGVATIPLGEIRESACGSARQARATQIPVAKRRSVPPRVSYPYERCLVLTPRAHATPRWRKRGKAGAFGAAFFAPRN